MFNSIGYTYRLHVYDMFDEILVMATRGLIKVLCSLFVVHRCFPILLLLLSYCSILGSDLGSRPENVVQVLGT